MLIDIFLLIIGLRIVDTMVPVCCFIFGTPYTALQSCRTLVKGLMFHTQLPSNLIIVILLCFYPYIIAPLAHFNLLLER